MSRPLSKIQKLEAVKPGIIQTESGQARSVDVIRGQQFIILSQQKYYYIVKFEKEVNLTHDSGLSGKVISKNNISSNNIKCIIRKQHVIELQQYKEDIRDF